MTRSHIVAGVLTGLLSAALLPSGASQTKKTPAVAQKSPTVTPLPLRLKFKAGTQRRYRVVMQMKFVVPVKDQAPMNSVAETNMVQEHLVTKALPDGGEVTATVIQQQNSYNGHESPSQELLPTTTQFDSRGGIKSQPGMQGGNPGDGMMSGLFPVNGAGGIGSFLPENAVRPGDTWTQKFDLPGVGKNGTVKCTFLRFEKIGRYNTARLRAQAEIPLEMLTDAQGQPVQDAAKATLIARGKRTVTTDYNLAIAEGFFVRTYASGVVTMALQPKPGTETEKAEKALPVTDTTIRITIGVSLIQ